ncbi:MAG: aminotransferase class IV family protein [Phycisphaerae bacterium]|nr:aminotransferase class IV family protein [Phycisphaerae bacterium]
MASVFLNGEFLEGEDARIAALDAGLQHAVGLFETVSGGITESGRAWCVHLEPHCRRLVSSARELGISATLRHEALGRAIMETLARSELDHARVRLTITGGDLNLVRSTRRVGPEAPAPEPTVLIVAEPATAFPGALFERGATVMMADAKANPFNPLEGHKTLAYWWRLRELARAARLGGGEAIVTQVSNHLCGGCVSNVFVVRNGELLTPIARGEEGTVGANGDAPPSGAALPSPVLPGVVRGELLAWAARAAQPARRRMLSINDLLGADEVFLTNSAWGVMPVTRIEGASIGGGEVGEVTRTAIGWWESQIEDARVGL